MPGKLLKALGVVWVVGLVAGCAVPPPPTPPPPPPPPAPVPTVVTVRASPPPPPKVQVVADSSRCKGSEDALLGCIDACWKSDESACGAMLQTCEEGNARACAYSGSWVESRRGSDEASARRMLRYFDMACDGGWSGACARLANIFANGAPGVSVDLVRAAAYAKKLMEVARGDCDRGDANGCMTVGNGADQGFGMEKDAKAAKVAYARGYELMHRACDRRDGLSCHMLSVYYDQGTGRPADKARARQLLERACSIGGKHQEASCLMLKELREKERPAASVAR